MEKDQKMEIKSSSEIKEKSLSKSMDKRTQAIIAIIVGLLLLCVISIISISFAMFLSKNNDKAEGLQAQITQINDGVVKQDMNLTDEERGVEIKVMLHNLTDQSYELNNYTDINLVLDNSNFVLPSNNSGDLVIFSDNDKEAILYFVVPKSAMLDRLVIKNSRLKNHIELSIDSNSDIYNIAGGSTVLPTPTDDINNGNITTSEYAEIKQKIQGYIDNPTSLKRLTLDKAKISIALPVGATAEYFETPQLARDHEELEQYTVDPDCVSINKTTLTPTSDRLYCKGYSLSYTIESGSKLVSVSRQYYIYLNTYPNTLIGILTENSVYSEEKIRVFEKDAIMKNIVNQYDTDNFTITNTPAADVIIVTRNILQSNAGVPSDVQVLETKLFKLEVESLR